METRSPITRSCATDFETLAENAPDIIARFDRDLRHMYVNPAIETATGVPRSEALGRTNREIGTPAETCDQWERLLRQCFAEPREYRAEFTVQRPSRPRRCYQVRVVPEYGADGSVQTVLAVVRDVTDLRHAGPPGPVMDKLQGWIDRIHPDDRMRAEQALAESERFARSTVDALSAHIAILDEHGTIIAANRAWEAFAEANGLSGERGAAGRPPCRSVGVNYLEICDRATGPNAEEASFAADGIRRVLAGDRENFYLEYPCHSPTEQRWFALRVTRFAGGPPVRLVVAHENITARRQAYELQREHASLRDAVTAMEQVLGVVGHELRTPLAGLRAISEFLLEGGIQDADQAATFLREMNDEVVRMSDTVNNLLEAARLNSGHATWNWTDFALERVCDEAMASVRPLIDHEAVSLTMTVADPTARMTGDPDAVRRLVMNLVSNAVKHTVAGSIHVGVEVVADVDRRRWTEVRVSDTGQGMPPEVAARLGEAFALNSGIVGAQYVKGSGLGLNICKGIVAAHGGTVYVDTKLGRGTTVTARLRADLPGPGTGRASIEVAQAAA